MDTAESSSPIAAQSDTTLWAVAAIACNVMAGLALEAWGAARAFTWMEPLIGALTVFHLSIYFIYPPRVSGQRVSRLSLVICLLLATAGELVLSFGLSLYKYRVSVLPLFVPPGHVLLFISGLIVSAQAWCRSLVTWLIPAGAALFLAVFAASGQDLLSVPLFLIFILCLGLGREKKLYAVMFLLALALELWGTRMATWQWQPRVTSLGLSAGNPPLAAGAFYACLDLLTVRIRRIFGLRSS